MLIFFQNCKNAKASVIFFFIHICKNFACTLFKASNYISDLCDLKVQTSYEILPSYARLFLNHFDIYYFKPFSNLFPQKLIDRQKEVKKSLSVSRLLYNNTIELLEAIFKKIGQKKNYFSEKNSLFKKKSVRKCFVSE